MSRKSKRRKAKHYTVRYLRETPPGLSPYRLVEVHGREVSEVNDFLDAQATRGLSLQSLRSYAYSLLNFWRWPGRADKDLSGLEEADLLDYIRFQRSNPPKENLQIAPKTIKLRITTVRCLYHFHSGRDLPAGKGSFRTRSHPFYNTVASDVGYLHPSRPRTSRLRVIEPRRVIVPLTTEEVRLFLENLRTWRDLAIAAVMLLCGLRSREVIGLTLEDLSLAEGQVRVRGKGGKERVVPLSRQVTSLLRSYLEVERPQARTPELFLCLKGEMRGQPMTPAGLRSLFRYHRHSAGVAKANPHRFRHTFGTDMARAGISLPALQRLLGHGHIKTTMIYVELSPKDVWEEFQRVLRKIPRERVFPKGD